MKFGTKLNHIIKAALDIHEEHPECEITVSFKGPITDYGTLKGPHTLTLERPGERNIHHNVTIDNMINLVAEFQKILDQ